MRKFLNIILVVSLLVTALVSCGNNIATGDGGYNNIIIGENSPEDGVFYFGMTIDEALSAINENQFVQFKDTTEGWDERGVYQVGGQYKDFGVTKGILTYGKFFLGFTEDEKLVTVLYDTTLSDPPSADDLKVNDIMGTQKGLKIYNSLSDAKSLYGEPEQTIDKKDIQISVFKASDNLYLQTISYKTENEEIVTMLFSEKAMPDFF